MAKIATNRGASRADVFGNFYKTTLVSTVADTLAVFNWDTGFSIKDGYGFVIHKIEAWLKPSDVSLPNADADRITVALITNNTLTGATIEGGNNDSILEAITWQLKLATAVGQQFGDYKIIRDFTNEPGGGRLIAPKPLYFAHYSQGCGATLTINVKVVYTMLKLTEQMYRELYESMNPSA